MVNYLVGFDKKLFLILNGFHFDFLDPIMLFLSNNFIVFSLMLIIFLLDFYKRFKLKKTLTAFMFIIFCVASSDLISTRLFKQGFKKTRPCYTKEIRKKVHSVGSCYGGKYGFVSSHASNTLAFSFILFLLAVKRRKGYTFLIGYSILVSYSRIYVGKHYPLDIIVGGFLGVSLAYTWFYLSKKILKSRI
jgi:undecaprenyl-diphosphatase